MEGISRIDAEKARGWYVRIYYEENIHSKFFSDSVYGSKNKALKEAIQYRKTVIRQNPPPPRLPVHRKPLPTNTSGVHGVSETHTRSKRGEIVPCFSVFWAPKPNVRKVKKFYHHHYSSREEAFEAAAEFRKEREEEILKRWSRKQGTPIEDLKAAIQR